MGDPTPKRRKGVVASPTGEGRRRTTAPGGGKEGDQQQPKGARGLTCHRGGRRWHTARPEEDCESVRRESRADEVRNNDDKLMSRWHLFRERHQQQQRMHDTITSHTQCNAASRAVRPTPPPGRPATAFLQLCPKGEDCTVHVVSISGARGCDP